MNFPMILAAIGVVALLVVIGIVKKVKMLIQCAVVLGIVAVVGFVVLR